MDKNKAIKRIKSFGKVGFIVCVVMEVLVAVVFGFFVFCSAVVSDIPENLISFSTTYMMEGRISAASDSEISESDIEAIAKTVDTSGAYLFSANTNMKTDISISIRQCSTTL